MRPKLNPRIDILKAHKKVLLTQFISGSFVSGLLMFIGWNTIFPGYLIEADTPLYARIFIFATAFFFDAICILALYRIYYEFMRLRTDIRNSSKK